MSWQHAVVTHALHLSPSWSVRLPASCRRINRLFVHNAVWVSAYLGGGGGSAIHGRTFKQNLRAALSRCSHHALQHVPVYLFVAVILYQSMPIRGTEHRLLIFAAMSGVKTQAKWRKLHKQEPCWVMLLSWLHCIHTVFKARNYIWAMNLAA